MTAYPDGSIHFLLSIVVCCHRLAFPLNSGEALLDLLWTDYCREAHSHQRYCHTQNILYSHLGNCFKIIKSMTILWVQLMLHKHYLIQSWQQPCEGGSLHFCFPVKGNGSTEMSSNAYKITQLRGGQELNPHLSRAQARMSLCSVHTFSHQNGY